MKRLWNMHIKQKFTFIIVFLLLFNFIVPTYSQADFGGKLLSPIKQFVVAIADAGMWLVNYAFTGKVAHAVVYLGVGEMKQEISGVKSNRWDDVGDNGIDWPNFNITLEEVLANKLVALDVNILEPLSTKDYDENLTNDKTESALEKLRETVSKWYIALRNISIVGLLCILVYIGIRMIISSTSTEKAKYKQLIWNWLVAMCLVFVLHYIMAFTMFLVDKVNEVLVGTGEKRIELMTESDGSADQINLKDSENGAQTINYVNNFAEYARFYANLTEWEGISFAIVYVVLLVYTVWFVIIYVKRFIYMMFLTLMAPMVAFTYPMDKLGDGKAQAFDMWFKEYVFNALIQPFHLLIYTVFVGMALDFAKSNLIYTCVAIGFIIPAEKTLRKMFKMDRATATGALSGFAGGAMASTLINKLASGKSKSGGNGAQDGSKGKAEIPTKSPDEGGFLGTGNSNDITPEQFEAQGQAQSEQGRNTENEFSSNSAILGPDGQPIGSNANETPMILGADGQPISSSSNENEINPNWERSADGNGWVDTSESRRLPESPDSGRPIRQIASNNSSSSRGRIDGFKNMGRQVFKRTLGNKQGWKNFAKGTAKRAAGVALGGLVGAGAGIAALATGQDASTVLKATTGGAAAGYVGGSKIAGNIGSGAYSMYSTAKNDYLEGRYGAEYVNDKAAHEQYINSKENQKWLSDNFTNTDGTPLSKDEMNSRLEQSYELERLGISDNKDRVDAMKMEDRLYKERLQEAEERGELQGRDIEKLKKQYRDQARTKTAVAYKYAGQYKKSDLRDAKKVEQLQKELEAKITTKDTNNTMSPQQIKADAGKATKLVLEAAKVSDPRISVNNNSTSRDSNSRRTTTPRNV